MPKHTRAKGIAFEREVAKVFEDAGMEVRGLESGGDHFVVAANGTVYHGESKRHERVEIDRWLRQQERDCPDGMRRFLVFRRSRRPAYAVVPLEQLVEMMQR